MAIEQHPIPQDVAGYKFRLIGEMTIKQFAFLASGIILGLIVYSLPLPFFFKYPLAAVAVGLGAGIAFLPVEGRPMDKWLVAFIKSVYSPTQYVWQKQDGTEVVTSKVAPPTPKVPAAISTNVSSATPPPPTQPASVAPVAPAPPPVSPVSSSPAQTSTQQTPVTSETKSEPISQASVQTPPVSPPIPATPPAAPVSPMPVPGIAPQTPAPSPTKVSPTAPAPTAAATNTLPIPFTPTSPNTLVGMTLTPEGKILENALIEIKSKGVSLRATKSNQLGQFLFAKPLENGLYQILTERPGFVFDTYSIELRGQIVKPLRLQAKANA